MTDRRSATRSPTSSTRSVEDAIKARRVDATDGATRYLVALLADYAHPDGRRARRSSAR